MNLNKKKTRRPKKNTSCNRCSYLRGTTERLIVLDTCRLLFESIDHFNELRSEERKFIAGIDNELILDNAADWAFFGSMVGSGDFVNRVHADNELLSLALDEIPLLGDVTRRHYNAFVSQFKLLFL